MSPTSRPRPPVLTLALVALSAGLLASPGASAVLAFERDALATEPWRLLTGHLVHARSIAAVDLVLLGLLGAWWERRSRVRWAAILLASALLASAALVCLTDFARYTGSSALSSGLFVAAALALVRGGGGGRLAGALALALFVAKVALEAAGQGGLFVDLPEGVRVAAAAHVAGGVGGALVELARRRRRATNR